MIHKSCRTNQLAPSRLDPSAERVTTQSNQLRVPWGGKCCVQLATELAANFAMLLRPLHGLKAFCQFIWKFMPRTQRPRRRPKLRPRLRLRLGRRFLWAPGKKSEGCAGCDWETDRGGEGSKARNCEIKFAVIAQPWRIGYTVTV